MPALLEIAVFNLVAALRAEKAGAGRLEMCENPADGGTTPSYGTLKRIKEKIRIPVFPIIRPRGGDFLYNDEEFTTMRDDILLCRQLGYEGVVTGMLLEDGTVDQTRMKELVQLAYPMEVTFHRAFDRTRDPMEALEAVIACGCWRILTSGQVPQVADALPLVRALVEQAGDRINIMPGSGVRASNIAHIATATGATEFHSSASLQRPSAMHFHRNSMQEALSFPDVDTDEIVQMQQILQDLSV